MYYFPEDFEFNRRFFNKNKIEKTTRSLAFSKVKEWFVDNSSDLAINEKFIRWIEDGSVNKIDINYEWGVFYYYYLNQYIYDISNAVWLFAYNYAKRDSSNEKVCNKAADSKRDEFVKWCLENFK